ncbi:MAG: InlB B-repeat-containing protein [Clostridia bacterium]
MKKRVLALFMAVSLASASFPMTAWATEIDVIPQQEESGVVEEPETTEELEKTEAPAEKSEVSEEQSATEQPETVEVTEQPETTEETEVVEEPEVTEETENVKEQEIEPLDVETEEAGEQGISIEEVLKNRTGGLAPAQGTALSEAEAGQFKEINPEQEQDIPAYGSAVYQTEWDKYSSNYIYNNLNSTEQTFWDALDYVCALYLTGEDDAVSTSGMVLPDYTISYSSLSLERATDIFLMFNYSNPQYYFINGGYAYIESRGILVPTFYTEFQSGSKRSQATQAMKNTITSWESTIASAGSTEQKAKAAHDLIAKKVQYDDNYLTNPENPFHQSAYSVFCDDHSVCAGYTKAFEMLMNGAGIDTIAVLSTDHAWNMIRINDSWYHMDCTWDDLDGYAGYEIIYKFFNRSEAVIKSDGTHEIESMFDGKLPASTLDSGANNTSIGKCATPSKKTAAPKITCKSVKNGVQVAISSTTSNAEIYYTVNGSTASSSYTKSYRYKQPFTVSKKTNIKAIAVKDTYWNSDQTGKTVDGRVYTVNFKSNGGSSVSKQYVQYNKTIKKPSNPKRSKYIFCGWYSDSKLTKAWNFNNKITSGKTLYAKWKKISLKKATISKMQNVSGRKLKVTVKKVSGADGYQIQYSTKSNMKSAKNVSSSKTTTTISKLSKGKKYYVRVKAYKKDSTGKKVAGKWSKVKNLKVSK